MNNGSKAQAIRETVLLTIISVIIISASLYVPILYFAGYFIWPIPLALVYIRHNIGFSVLSIIITTALVTLISDPVSALTVIFSYGGIGIALGYSVRNKEKLGFTLLTMFAASFVASLMSLQAFNMIAGYNVISASIDAFIKNIGSMKDAYVGLGVPKEQLDALFKTVLDANAIKAIVPSFIVIHSIIVAFLTYWGFEKVMKKSGVKVETLKSFSELYIPTGLSMTFMVFALIGFMFLPRGTGGQEQYLTNIYLIFTFIFSINGLAAISYFLRKKGFPKIIVFIVLAFLIITPAAQFLIYIGLADYVLNFRRLDDRKNIRNRKN